MRVTQRARDLPFAILLPPHDGEFARALAGRRRVAEAMRTRGHDAVARQREGAEGRDIELAPEFPADILAHAVFQFFHAHLESVMIVVELDVLREECQVLL